MRRLRDVLALLAVLVLVHAGSQVQAANGNGSGKNNVHARAVLVRVDDAADADAKGKIDFYVKKGEYKLHIKAQRLTGLSAVDFVLLDADGEPEEVIRGNVAVETDDDGDGSAKIKLYSKDGDTFDGDGTTIDDALVGRLVGVRTAGDDDDEIDLLIGVIPDLVKGGPKKYKHKNKNFGTDDKGQCQFEWREKDGRVRFTLKAQTGLAEGAQVQFKLEWAGGDHVLGTGAVNEDGKAKLKFRSDHGDSLPRGILKDIGQMSGATVRICWDPGTGEETVAEDTLPTL